MAISLQQSYRACRRITRKASSNFWLATLLFDMDTRKSLRALYAFCRTADDIADGTGLTQTDRVGRLRQMRQAITHQKPVGVAADIWPALFDTMRHHKLPVAELETVLKGVASDTAFRQPASYQELDRYSYQVAGAVGVLSARILGAFKQSTLEGAKQLGIAMQYTNIIRDVAADRELQRVYLPTSVMRAKGLTPGQLMTGTNNTALKQVLAALANRADTYYDHALPAIADLHPSYQKPVLVALRLYRSILERIKQKRYNVTTERVRLSRLDKLRLVARVYLDRS